MANTAIFILSTLQNKIQKVVLNRPAKKNAFSSSMYREMAMLLNESAKNDEVLMFVLTANGDFFSSGTDITDTTVTDTKDLPYKQYVDALITYPKLLVAIVNGPAIGISCTTLALFDMVYATNKAYFHTPFSTLGLIGEACSTYTFPRLLGHSKAGDMLYMGYKMDAKEAKQRGLVSEVYNQDSLDEIWRYLNNISTLSPESILATKRLMSKWNQDILLKVNAEEERELQERLQSSDIAERIIKLMTEKSRL